MALELTGQAPGTAAGIDVRFTNGRSVWVPVGMGLCLDWCPKQLSPTVAHQVAARR